MNWDPSQEAPPDVLPYPGRVPPQNGTVSASRVSDFPARIHTDARSPHPKAPDWQADRLHCCNHRAMHSSPSRTVRTIRLLSHLPRLRSSCRMRNPADSALCGRLFQYPSQPEAAFSIRRQDDPVPQVPERKHRTPAIRKARPAVPDNGMHHRSARTPGQEAGHAAGSLSP